jgi:hypothetical protein
MTVAGIPLLDLSGNEQLGHESGGLDKTGQSLEMVRGTGFEPAGSPVQQQPLTDQGTQGGTQNIFDPDLAKIVTAWPALAPALKAAIWAIIQSK